MSPKALATPETLRQRELAAELNTGNGHTAHHPVPQVDKGANPAAPRWGGVQSLTLAQRALIS